MRIPVARLLAAALAAFSPAAAAPMQKAEVTRTHNEVRILPAGGDSRDAKPGDVVDGRTAVRTGDKSRAELKFTDETLTRLGANSQFSFETGTRNLSLENGVIFLQVPKGAGGAKIQTAAVTAAVTGTTIMMEYVQGKVLKIIVIEGTLDVYYPDRPGEFITLRAGQMIMMRPDAMGFPRPVDVDIDKLLETSDLAGDGGVFDPVGGEAGQAIQDAINEQNEQLKDGKLIGTNLIIPGRGNKVVVMTGNAALAFRADGKLPFFGPRPPGARPIPPGANPPRRPPPEDPRFLPPPLLGGNWRLHPSMAISPDVPQVTQAPLQGAGSIYLPDATGPLHPWLFGSAETVPGDDLAALLDGTGPWSTFLFSNLTVEGTPVTDPNAPRNILIASPNTIRAQAPDLSESPYSWSLEGAPNWGLFTQGGSIELLSPEFSINGNSSNLILHANGPTANIDLASAIQLGQGNLATFSGGDTNLFGSIFGAQYLANSAGSLHLENAHVHGTSSVEMNAGTGVTMIGSTVLSGEFPQSEAAITVNDSDGLAALVDAAGTGGRVLIKSTTGDVRLSGSTFIEARGAGSRVDVVAVAGDVELGGIPEEESYVTIVAEDTIRLESLGGATPRVSLNLATLYANNIEIQANGQGSVVELTDSNINAVQSARLIAEGPGSVLQFGGFTVLRGDTVRLAGETVRVLQNGIVDATQVNRLGIHATNHEYNLNTLSLPNWGVINTGEGTVISVTDYEGRNGEFVPPPSF